MSEREGDDDVDPRFDPRFQRGYDRARHPSRAAPPRSAARSPFARPSADEPESAVGGSVDVRPMPVAEGSTEPAASPAEDEGEGDGAEHNDEQEDLQVERGSSRAWLIGLAALSVIATAAGVIGVITLLTEPPLRLTLAAETLPASLRIALELIAGPVLTAGLVGVAVVLVLVLAGRPDRR